jgi:hypothetical protein
MMCCVRALFSTGSGGGCAISSERHGYETRRSA